MTENEIFWLKFERDAARRHFRLAVEKLAVATGRNVDELHVEIMVESNQAHTR